MDESKGGFKSEEERQAAMAMDQKGEEIMTDHERDLTELAQDPIRVNPFKEFTDTEKIAAKALHRGQTVDEVKRGFTEEEAEKAREFNKYTGEKPKEDNEEYQTRMKVERYDAIRNGVFPPTLERRLAFIKSRENSTMNEVEEQRFRDYVTELAGYWGAVETVEDRNLVDSPEKSQEIEKLTSQVRQKYAKLDDVGKNLADWTQDNIFGRVN